MRTIDGVSWYCAQFTRTHTLWNEIHPRIERENNLRFYNSKLHIRRTQRQVQPWFEYFSVHVLGMWRQNIVIGLKEKCLAPQCLQCSKWKCTIFSCKIGLLLWLFWVSTKWCVYDYIFRSQTHKQNDKAMQQFESFYKNGDSANGLQPACLHEYTNADLNQFSFPHRLTSFPFLLISLHFNAYIFSSSSSFFATFLFL